MKWLRTIPLIILSHTHPGLSQPELTSEFGNSLVECLKEDEENYGSAAEIYEDIVEVLSHRENINLVNKETLQKLPFLTDFQVHSFLLYREKYGRIFSANELWLIHGFHADLIKKFKILFDFGNPVHHKDPRNKSKSPLRQKILTRLIYQSPLKEGSTGYSDSMKIFHGIPVHRLIRYELDRINKFRTGFTLENDAGESFTNDSLWKGFNFKSAFLEIRKTRVFDKLILGDYRISSAEGLIYNFGRNGKSTGDPFRRSLPQIKKYSSSSEYGFYRGICSQLIRGNFRLIAFISSQNGSATLHSDPDGSEYFTSFNSSGYFRNDTETRKWHKIKQRDAGMITSLSTDQYQVGYSLKHSFFNPEFEYQVRGDPWSGRIRTSSFLWQSVFYYLQLKNMLFTGEMAWKSRGGISFIQKASLSLHPLFTMNLGYRNFSPEYFCPGAGSLSESGEPRNEKGFFTGIITYPFSFLKLNAYFDIYYFPWINYQSTFPIRGNELMVNLEWYLHEDLDLKIYFKTENKEKMATGNELGIRKMEWFRIDRYYGQYTWKINKYLNTRFRLELKYRLCRSKPNSYGILLYQEMNSRFLKEKLNLNLRFSIFDIPEWDVRIYAWEHDLLYSFNSPSHYKTGQSFFLNVKWNCARSMNFSIKISATEYISERESGSGADYRKGKRFYELKGQVLIKL